MRPVARVGAALVTTVGAAACLLGQPGSAGADRAGGAVGGRPNIVVVVTDDQDLPSLSRQTMPATTRLLARAGTRFTEAIATTPLCCPSRASFLTGQYGHNHGVLYNDPGGYPDLHAPGNTLPVWLSRAGYRTVHVGRYLNRYAAATGDPLAVAPGWDRWHTLLGAQRYYGYTLSRNGAAVRYGERPGDYFTRVVNRTARRSIRRYAPRRRPIFLAVDQVAPHNDWTRDEARTCRAAPAVDPLDARRFLDEPLPMPTSSNEADVSDKPGFVAAQPPLSKAAVADIEQRYRCRLASLRSVDRGVRALVGELRRAGELRQTAFLFTSDNGYLQGHHRVAREKRFPYEESVRVPLLVRLPQASGRQARVVDEPVANIDLAPTILALAKAQPCGARAACRTMDGRSLLGLIGQRTAGWPEDRALALELHAPGPRVFPGTPCTYQGIRTATSALVRYARVSFPASPDCVPTDDAELYDLEADPLQLDNLHPTSPGSPQASLEAELQRRLERLERCAGIRGRDERRPGIPFCQ